MSSANIDLAGHAKLLIAGIQITELIGNTSSRVRWLGQNPALQLVRKGSEMKPLRAISIRQPYVEQILRGTKRIEYRSIPTNIRERVYLYASLKPADDPEAWAETGATPGDLVTGAILGTVEITGCRRGAGEGDYRYILARPKRLRAPVRAKNQPQPVFWRPRI